MTPPHPQPHTILSLSSKYTHTCTPPLYMHAHAHAPHPFNLAPLLSLQSDQYLAYTPLTYAHRCNILVPCLTTDTCDCDTWNSELTLATVTQGVLNSLFSLVLVVAGAQAMLRECTAWSGCCISGSQRRRKIHSAGHPGRSQELREASGPGMSHTHICHRHMSH